MDISSPIIEECFDNFLKNGGSLETYTLDPELIYQLNVLGGDNVQSLLVKNACLQTNEGNWNEELFRLATRFLILCNRLFGTQLKFDTVYDGWKMTKVITEKNSDMIKDFSDLFKKDLNYKQTSKTLLNGGQYINIYWAVPNYVNGKIAPFKQMSLIGPAVSIEDLYNIVGSEHRKKYRDMPGIIKGHIWRVKMCGYGVCIECYPKDTV